MSIKLINIDCMEYMAGLDDNVFDLAIVDPPYGIGNWVQISGNVRGSEIFWNNNIPKPSYFDELGRISKDQIIWGANYFNCFNGRGGAIVWNKRVPRETNFSVCEIASYSRLARTDYVDLIWQNIHRDEDIIHPCQKPVRLYDWILQNYAKPEMGILDTHLGSGSSAIAAHYFGCDFVGCEIDRDYFELAQKRFNRETQQIDFKFE